MRLYPAAALALALVAAGPAAAQSTINTGVPAQGAPLNSLPIRQNFAAAAADINGILGMHAQGTLGACPASPLIGTDCLVSGSPSATWYKWAGPGAWSAVGTFSNLSGTFTPNIPGSVTLTGTTLSGTTTVSLGGTLLFAGSGFGITASATGNAGLFGLQVLSGGNHDTGAGVQAGSGLTTGSNDTLVGYQAGNALTSGSSNTIVGAGVGSTTLSTGSNNVLIGTSSSVDTAGAGTSNTICIGAGAGCILLAVGTGTPATSTMTIAGNLSVTGSFSSGGSNFALAWAILGGGLAR